MADLSLPAHVETLISGTIDTQVIAKLREHFLVDPMTAERADQLFLIADRVGDRSTPELQKFLQEALAQFFLQDLDPVRMMMGTGRI